MVLLNHLPSSVQRIYNSYARLSSICAYAVPAFLFISANPTPYLYSVLPLSYAKRLPLPRPTRKRHLAPFLTGDALALFGTGNELPPLRIGDMHPPALAGDWFRTGDKRPPFLTGDWFSFLCTPLLLFSVGVSSFVVSPIIPCMNPM